MRHRDNNFFFKYINIFGDIMITFHNLLYRKYSELIAKVHFILFENKHDSLFNYINSLDFWIIAIFYTFSGYYYFNTTHKYIILFIIIIAILFDIFCYYLVVFKIFTLDSFYALTFTRAASLLFFYILINFPEYAYALLEIFVNLRDFFFISAIIAENGEFFFSSKVVSIDNPFYLDWWEKWDFINLWRNYFLYYSWGSFHLFIFITFFYGFFFSWLNEKEITDKLDIHLKIVYCIGQAHKFFASFLIKYFTFWAYPVFYMLLFGIMYLPEQIPYTVFTFDATFFVFNDLVLTPDSPAEFFFWWFLLNGIVAIICNYSSFGQYCRDWINKVLTNNYPVNFDEFLALLAKNVFIIIIPAYWLISNNGSILVFLGDAVNLILASGDFLEYFWIYFFYFLTRAFVFSIYDFAKNDFEQELPLVNIFYAFCFSSTFFLGLATNHYRQISTSILERGIFSRFNLGEFFFESPSQLFIFGCDYLTYLICIMTSIVFTIVFYFSIYSVRLNYKRLYFWTLTILYIFIILSFTSLNIFTFFFFFEATILPVAFLIFQWGSSNKKYFAARQYVFYSIVGGLPLLVALANIYNVIGSFDYIYVLNNLSLLSLNEQRFLWFSFFLIFAVKVPIFPFHSWLLNAHVEASTGVSIILAAVMLKIGAFGIIRYLFGLLHYHSVEYANYVIFLAVIGIFYSSVAAISENDLKRIIAYTSIAHMNLAIIGLFIFDESAFYGAAITILSHGITSTALFFLVGILYSRFNTKDIIFFGGLVQVMPICASFFFFFLIANSGFPCSLSFIAELFLFLSFFKKLSITLIVVLAISLILLLYANLRLFMFVSFGNINIRYCSIGISDLSHVELAVCIFLAVNGIIAFINFDYYFYPIFIDFMSRYFI